MNSKLELNFIEKLVFSNYKIRSKAVQLDGEKDDNFKLVAKNKSYFFKIYPVNTKKDFVKFQTNILYSLKKNNNTSVNTVTINGRLFGSFVDENNNLRFFRANSWIEGRLWSKVNPINKSLRLELGKVSAEILNGLKSVKKVYSRKNFHWDLQNFLWTEQYIDLLELSQKRVVKKLIAKFKKVEKKYKKLRKSIIHNDVNDNNIIVSENLKNPTISGIIDFGDCIYSQLINEVAILCTYSIIGSENPLISACDVLEGFNNNIKLKEKEIDFLYDLILMRITVSIVKSKLNERLNRENKYLVISQDDMKFLFDKWSNIDKDLATCFFRKSCGYSAHKNEKKFKEIIKTNVSSLKILFKGLNDKIIQPIDMGVNSEWLENEMILHNEAFEEKLKSNTENKLLCGGYMEVRPVYDSSDYEKITDYGIQNRTTHLGIDFWVNEKTSIYSIMDGFVKIITNDKTKKGYGGLIIIEHLIEDVKYFSLYGHLSDQKKSKIKKGQVIKKGQKIGEIGSKKENGGWTPHLHFQIMLSLFDFKDDFPGVCFFNEKDIWSSICPNPEKILNIKLPTTNIQNNDELLKLRNKYLGANLKLSYQKPLHIVRGLNQFLFDNDGRKYLDTVNNIAHVGHQNINVVKSAKSQLSILNTNTRYLHKEILELSEKLIQKFPKKLSKIYFVNSGSEANELAIRMSEVYTKSNNHIVSKGGYHGNTNYAINLSNYKYMSKGGKGKLDNIYEIPMPDMFRGKYRGKNTSKKYFSHVEKIVNRSNTKKGGISSMIIEPILSCGGQIELPKTFLKKCHTLFKKNNIVLICDEVQTGFGRVGEKYWGFELYDVIPDIVTLGKPMGNGHPIGAVVCSKEISDKFNNGMEFFSSFGGNPVSCKIASEVIDTIESENLQSNAYLIGNYIKIGLNKLAKKYPIIGDVRGRGLFIGFELVDEKLNPLKEKAKYLKNRMKDLGFLMSNDGIDHNVIKIKPPMIFNKKDAENLLFFIEKVLNEDFIKYN